MFRRLDDIGDGVSVRWCKGHATQAHVDQGLTSLWLMKANDNADHFAKYGSALAKHLQPSFKARADNDRALAWYKGIGTLASS